MDYIVYSAAARVPKEAATLFPEMTEEALKACQVAESGRPDRHDHQRWLPQQL